MFKPKTKKKKKKKKKKKDRRRKKKGSQQDSSTAPSAPRDLYQIRQLAKFAGFSARFRRLLSLLQKTYKRFLTQGQCRNVMFKTVFLNKSCCGGRKVLTITFVFRHIGYRDMNA